MLQVKLKDNGDIDYTSRANETLDLSVPINFFNKYPAYCWHSEDGKSLVLKDNYLEIAKEQHIQKKLAQGGIVIKIESPISAQKGVPFDVAVSVLELESDNVVDSVSGEYFVPLKNAMTGELDQIIQLTLVDGSGQQSVTVTSPGIYDIAEEFIRPKPQFKIERTIDIVVV